jgi:hypothetical protein
VAGRSLNSESTIEDLVFRDILFSSHRVSFRLQLHCANRYTRCISTTTFVYYQYTATTKWSSTILLTSGGHTFGLLGDAFFSHAPYASGNVSDQSYRIVVIRGSDGFLTARIIKLEALSTREDCFMAPETFLRGASLLQLTEALISKSDQVFVPRFLTAKTLVTFWRSFLLSGSPPTGRVS